MVFSVMQKGIMEYLKKPTAETLEAGVAEIRNTFLKIPPSSQSVPGVSIQIALRGKQAGREKRKFSFSANNLISCMRMDKHKKILSCVLT